MAKSLKVMWFKDEGQDILCWVISEVASTGMGIVTACNAQESVWKGFGILGTDRNNSIEDIQPGDHLICLSTQGRSVMFIHAVEKVENWSPRCRDCRFISEKRVFKEGDDPKLRCMRGLWDFTSILTSTGKKERWLAFGPVVLNRGPARRYGDACVSGIPKPRATLNNRE
jgi:hypothetical protein